MKRKTTAKKTAPKATPATKTPPLSDTMIATLRLMQRKNGVASLDQIDKPAGFARRTFDGLSRRGLVKAAGKDKWKLLKAGTAALKVA